MSLRFVRLICGLGIAICLSSVSLHGAEWQQSESTSKTSVPRLIVFNGTLRDSTGQPRAGSGGLRFALYKEQEGGAPLWAEIQNVEVDEQGRYAVLLGAATSDGLPIDLFTSTETRWLGVQPNGIGEREQARILMVSVPYALKAADADTLGGRPLSSFVLTDPGASTGSTSNGVKGVDGPLVSAVSGTGTANKVPKWVDAAGTLGDSVIAESSDNVGIGTVSPLSPLQVAGTATFGRGGTSAGNVGAVQIAGFDFGPSPAPISGRLIFGTDGSGWKFGIARNQLGSIKDLLTVGDDGKVGIGTSSPASPLQVAGSATFGIGGANPARIGNVQIAGYEFGIGGLQAPVSGRVIFGTDGSGWKFAIAKNQSGSIQDLLTIGDEGKVGIGTSSPTANLEVVGTLKATAFVGSGAGLTNVGDITSVTAGTGLTGGAAAGDATLALSSSSRARAITYLGGCDTCSILADTDDQRTIYVNILGPATIDSVTCFSDAGTPSIMLQRDDGTPSNILSSPLACSPSGATTSSFAGLENGLNLNDRLDFVMLSAGGTAKRVTVIIKTTLN